MRLEYLINELNQRVPSFEEHNKFMNFHGLQSSSFESYKDSLMFDLRNNKYKKYKFNFENDLLNDMFSYKFVTPINSFSLLYKEIKLNSHIVFGDIENGRLIAFNKSGKEVVSLVEDDYSFQQYCSSEIDLFFQFLIEIEQISKNYHYKKILLTQENKNRLVTLVGGEKYRNFIEDFTLQYTDFY